MLAAPAPRKLTFDLKAAIAALAGPAVGADGARLGAAPAGWSTTRLVDVRIALWLVHPDAGDVSDNLAAAAPGSRRAPAPSLTQKYKSQRPPCSALPSISSEEQQP